MAKTKYVKFVSEDYSYFRAYRDPDGDGWQLTLDGNDLWLSDVQVADSIKFLTKLQKKASK